MNARREWSDNRVMSYSLLSEWQRFEAAESYRLKNHQLTRMQAWGRVYSWFLTVIESFEMVDAEYLYAAEFQISVKLQVVELGCRLAENSSIFSFTERPDCLDES